MYNITSSLSLSQALYVCPAAHQALNHLANNADNKAKIMSLEPDFSQGEQERWRQQAREEVVVVAREEED